MKRQIITQKELAARIRIPANTLCKFLAGNSMSVDNISRVWRVTEIPLETLFNGSVLQKRAALEEWCGKRINFGRGRL